MHVFTGCVVAGGEEPPIEVCLLAAWREVSARAREGGGVSGRGYYRAVVCVSAVVVGRRKGAEFVQAMPLMSPASALTCRSSLSSFLELPSRFVSPSVSTPLSALVLSL